MKTCVIFNPTAKGEKARRFRRHLDEIGTQATLKLTTAAGDARRLAALAVREGFKTVVAAGGDGTINEVLNGVAAEPKGPDGVRLGILPLGTVNVFARELAIPLRPTAAWACILEGKETLIDLPQVEYSSGDTRCSRYFAQLAGAGLDARAIELVKWELKKKLGPLAYVLAGLHALREPASTITVNADGRTATGGLVLIGNGRFYGGSFRIFPKADLRDARLDVCVFPRVNWFTLARCGPQLLLRGTLPPSAVSLLQGRNVQLTSVRPTPFEVDGELIGHLPAILSVAQRKLRVIVP